MTHSLEAEVTAAGWASHVVTAASKLNAGATVWTGLRQLREGETQLGHVSLVSSVGVHSN